MTTDSDDVRSLTLRELSEQHGRRLNQRDLDLLSAPPFCIHTVGDVLDTPLDTYSQILGFGARRKNDLRSLMQKIGYEMDYRKAERAELLVDVAAADDSRLLKNMLLTMDASLALQNARGLHEQGKWRGRTQSMPASLNTHIGHIGLNTRTYNALVRQGIESLMDLASVPDTSALKYLGKTNWGHLVEVMHRLGFRHWGSEHILYVDAAGLTPFTFEEAADRIAQEGLLYARFESGEIREEHRFKPISLLPLTQHYTETLGYYLRRTIHSVRFHCKSPQPVAYADLSVLNTPIDALELNARARHSLQAEDIRFVGQLICLSNNQLTKLPNLGAGSVRHISDQLFALSGLSDEWRKQPQIYLPTSLEHSDLHEAP